MTSASDENTAARPAIADSVAIVNWFGTLGISVREPVDIAPIGQGQSNLTLCMTDANGSRWVLRRPPLGHRLASAHDISREARILSALAPTDVPAPKILGVSEDVDTTGDPWAAMTFVDGVVLEDTNAAEGLSAHQRAAVGPGLIDALARIHDVDLDATGLASLSSHRSYAERQLRRWMGQWQQSQPGESTQAAAVFDRLQAATPKSSELTLVHGDFHLRNLIFGRQDLSVQAVLDWELSTLGDPVADVGTLLAYWPQAGEAAPHSSAASTLSGFPSRAELAAAYSAKTGRSLESLGFWQVLGIWKVAIIAEGVRSRAAARDPESSVADSASDVVGWLLQQAWDTADAVGI